jgi:hypothetical protein
MATTTTERSTNAYDPELKYRAVLPGGQQLLGIEAYAFIRLLAHPTPDNPLKPNKIHEELYPGKPFNHRRIAQLVFSLREGLGEHGTIRNDYITSRKRQLRAGYYSDIPDEVRTMIRIEATAKPKRPDIPRFVLPNGIELTRNWASLMLELLDGHFSLESAIPADKLSRKIFRRDRYSPGDLNTLVYYVRKQLRDTGVTIQTKHRGKGDGGGSLPALVYLNGVEHLPEEQVRKVQERAENLRRKQRDHAVRTTYQALMSIEHSQWQKLSRWDQAKLEALTKTVDKAKTNEKTMAIDHQGVHLPLIREEGKVYVSVPLNMRPLVQSLVFIKQFNDWYNSKSVPFVPGKCDKISLQMLSVATKSASDTLAHYQPSYKGFHIGECMPMTRLVADYSMIVSHSRMKGKHPRNWQPAPQHVLPDLW